MIPKKHRISFKKLISVIDDEGIRQDEWQTIRSAWASVSHRSGAQRWSAGNYSSEVTDLFLIRAIPGWEPAPSMALVWRDRVYDVESVEDVREEHVDVEIRAVFREVVKA